MNSNKNNDKHKQSNISTLKCQSCSANLSVGQRELNTGIVNCHYCGTQNHLNNKDEHSSQSNNNLPKLWPEKPKDMIIENNEDTLKIHYYWRHGFGSALVEVIMPCVWLFMCVQSMRLIVFGDFEQPFFASVIPFVFISIFFLLGIRLLYRGFIKLFNQTDIVVTHQWTILRHGPLPYFSKLKYDWPARLEIKNKDIIAFEPQYDNASGKSKSHKAQVYMHYLPAKYNDQSHVEEDENAVPISDHYLKRPIFKRKIKDSEALYLTTLLNQHLKRH